MNSAPTIGPTLAATLFGEKSDEHYRECVFCRYGEGDKCIDGWLTRNPPGPNRRQRRRALRKVRRPVWDRPYKEYHVRGTGKTEAVTRQAWRAYLAGERVLMYLPNNQVLRMRRGERLELVDLPGQHERVGQTKRVQKRIGQEWKDAARA